METKQLVTKKDMIEALLTMKSKIDEQSEQLEYQDSLIENLNNQVEIMIEKNIDLEKENYYLRLLLKQLTKDKDTTIEGVLTNE